MLQQSQIGEHKTYIQKHKTCIRKRVALPSFGFRETAGGGSCGGKRIGGRVGVDPSPSCDGRVSFAASSRDGYTFFIPRRSCVELHHCRRGAGGPWMWPVPDRVRGVVRGSGRFRPGLRARHGVAPWAALGYASGAFPHTVPQRGEGHEPVFPSGVVAEHYGCPPPLSGSRKEAVRGNKESLDGGLPFL